MYHFLYHDFNQLSQIKYQQMNLKPLVYHPQARTVSKLWKEKKKDNESIIKQTEKIREESSQEYSNGKNQKIKLPVNKKENIISIVDNLQGYNQYYIFCSRCFSYFSESDLIKFSNCNHFFCQVCTNQFRRESPNKTIQNSCPFGCRNQQNPEPKVQKITQKKQPVKQSKIQCGICAQYFDLDQLKNITKCPHSFCSQCINDYVKQCLKDMKEVICPEGCRGQYHPRFQLQVILDKKQLQLYKKAQMIRNNLRMCSKKDCQYGILIQHEQLPRDVVECHACYARYCKKCQWPEHNGDCNNAAQNFIQKGLLFARCPGCNRNIQRNKGCNHITCVCRYQFCYLCLGKWSHNHLCDNNSRIFLINQQGNNARRQNLFQNGRNMNQIMQQINDFGIRREVERRRREERQAQAMQELRRRQRQRQRQRQIIQEQRRQQYQRMLEQKRQQQQRMRIIREEQQKKLQKQRQRGLQIMIEFKKKKKGKFRIDDDELHEYLQKKEKNMRLVPLIAFDQNLINRKNLMKSEKKIQKKSEEKIKWPSKDKQVRALQMRRNRIQAEKQKLFKQQQQKQKRMRKKMEKIMKNDYKILWETHFVL